MEYGLREDLSLYYGAGKPLVLILVLMEYGLRGIKDAISGAKEFAS